MLVTFGCLFDYQRTSSFVFYYWLVDMSSLYFRFFLLSLMAQWQNRTEKVKEFSAGHVTQHESYLFQQSSYSINVTVGLRHLAHSVSTQHCKERGNHRLRNLVLFIFWLIFFPPGVDSLAIALSSIYPLLQNEQNEVHHQPQMWLVSLLFSHKMETC